MGITAAHNALRLRLTVKQQKLIYWGTGDIRRRYLKEHKKGLVQSTKGKSPLLIHYEAYQLKSDAIRREKFLKTTDGKKLFRKQVRDLLR